MENSIIDDIILLSTLGDIDKKREVIHLICGGKMEIFNVKSRWYTGEIEKPQYFHSATSIYLLLTYPHFRPENSFVNLILKSGKQYEQAVLRMAVEILKSDSDGVNFLNNIDDNVKKDHAFLIIDESKNL